MKITKETMNKLGQSKLAKFLALPIMFTVVMGGIWLTGGKAKADTSLVTLQESVEHAQANYDLSQSQAKDAITAYCKSYVALAVAKNQLASELKIDARVIPVTLGMCDNLTVPSSF